jgi:hypothetical protein
MKKVISLTLSVFLVYASHAQDTKAIVTKAADVSAITKVDTTIKKAWDIGGLINIGFSQMAFTNWASGGQNAMGLSSLLSFHANYRHGKFKWLNDVQLGYGFQRIGDDGFIQKTTDQIAVNSNAGYRIFDHTLLSFLANIQTQFAPGYQYPNDSVLISKFFAPAYLVLGLGLTYSPKKWFSAFISPATARLTFVENQTLADEGAFGVAPAVYDALGNKIQNGKTELTQIGAYFRGDFSKEIVKNVNLTTTLELFSNYLKDPQNVIVNWVTFMQFKVNKYISATFNTQLIYDNNVLIPLYQKENGVNIVVGKGPRLQFKDVLGVGLAYNL